MCTYGTYDHERMAQADHERMAQGDQERTKHTNHTDHGPTLRTQTGHDTSVGGFANTSRRSSF